MLASEPKQAHRSATSPSPEWLTIAEAQALLRYGKTTMHKLLRSGEIPSRGKGRLRRIPRWAVEARQAEEV